MISKNTIINKRNISIAVATSLAVAFVVVAYFMPVSARGDIAGNPFGGRITNMYYCACSASWRVTIGSPVGGSFVYRPGSATVYEYGQVRTGVWALGTWTPGDACVIVVGESCVRLPTQGRISQIGTSL